MDRFSQIFVVDRTLRNSRVPVSRARLQELLEDCSSSTLTRVLRGMRDLLRAPIEYDRDKGGYSYVAAADGERFELPGLWFDAAELYALLSCHRLLGNIQPGFLDEHLIPLTKRIDDIFRQQRLRPSEVSRRVRILAMAQRAPSADIFKPLASALLQRRQIRVEYQGRTRNTVSGRLLSPQRLVHYRDNWYLDAWDHDKNGRERDAAHERATGPYEDHQWLWKFFPAEAGAARDHLFRRLDAEATLRFYVLSRRAPVSVGPAWCVRSREYAPQVQAGDRLRFDLRANPVVTHSRDGKRKRHDVVMQAKKKLLDEHALAKWEQWQSGEKPPVQKLIRESCASWLRTRAKRFGFEVDGESLAVDGYAQHRGRRGLIRISAVDFSGQLTVIDPVALKQALFGGIGHAKAFGCGLLLVRRVTG